MKEFVNTSYVEGTAALAPNYSQNKQGNERIIAFPQPHNSSVTEFYATDFQRLAKAGHISLRYRLWALVLSLVQKSPALYDLLTGSLQGKPLFKAKSHQVAFAACAYSLIAIAALYFAI